MNGLNFGSITRCGVLLAALAWAGPLAGAESHVQFLPKPRVWLLNLARGQYALGVSAEGELQHLWWGPRLPGGDIEAGAVTGTPLSAEGQPREEYPAWGGMRYYEPALKVHFADGVRDLRLRYQDHQLQGADRLFIRLKDPHYPLEVELRYRVFPEYDLVERSATLKNLGEAPVVIEQVLSAVWHPPHLQRWAMYYLAGRWGAETQLRQTLLDQGKFQLESRRGATSHQFNPWFALGQAGAVSEEAGEVWFGSLAWSGSWKIAAEVTSSGRLQVAGGIHDFDFAWQLSPGQTFQTPAFLGGFSPEGLGGASRRLAAYQLAEVLPKPQNAQLRPIIYNSWYATEFNVNARQQIQLAERAKALGVELFVMDDGWFGARNDDRAGLGDWWPNPEKFPQGLGPLISAVHSLGMKFGLWVEPEMVNTNSDLYRQHPDWVFHFPNRPRTEQRRQLMLNFARPEVKAHLFRVLDKLLSENAIDFIKWDMNRHIAEPGWPDAPTAQQREVWVRHARAVYELLDELRAKHPSVLWESCSGGGGRADLGILQRTDQVWTSDNTDPLDRLAIQEGYTHAFAPKTMVAWVTDNPDGINHRATPLAFRFHCAMLGTLGVGGDLLKWSEAELKEAKFHLDEYKAIRPLVQEGQLYRLRSPRDSATSAFEFVAADRTQAVLFVFLSASRMGDEQPTLRLAGLEPNARYRLESRQPPGESPLLSPRVLSGAALRERGLTLRWRGDYVSALIRLEVVR